MAPQGAIDVHFDFRSDTPRGGGPRPLQPYPASLSPRAVEQAVARRGRVRAPRRHSGLLSTSSILARRVLPLERRGRPDVPLVGRAGRPVGGRSRCPGSRPRRVPAGGLHPGRDDRVPGNQVDRRWTINQARGMLRHSIGDRLDLALECIRGLRRLLSARGPHDRRRERCELFLPCEGFERSALPRDLAEYDEYRLSSVAFVSARNGRIAAALA